MQQIPYIAVIFVAAGIASALYIAFDLWRRPQSMRIMNSVWVLTGLWAGVVGLWGYVVFGRAELKQRRPLPAEGKHAKSHAMAKRREMEMSMPGMKMPEMEMSMPGMKMPGMEMSMPGMKMPEMEMSMPQRPRWQSITLSTLHCGAGCTLADLIGESLLWLVPITLGGSLVAGSWVVDYLLALVIGIGFQYAAIHEMEPKTAFRKVILRATKADLLSLTAWQVGMFGWMSIVIFGFNGGEIPPRDTFNFWFMMQIAMGCGFALSYPVNRWLIHRGVKRAM